MPERSWTLLESREVSDHRIFLEAIVGIGTDGAVRYFRRRAERSAPDPSGKNVPGEVLVRLLWRLGRYAEAVDLLAETIQWLDDQRAMQHMLAQRCGLNSLKEWAVSREGYYAHQEERFFKIIGLDVTAAGREVGSWGQPVLSNPEHGVIGLLMTEQAGKRFFLMQAKAEVGNRNTVQLGPTVQFTPGNYTDNTRLHKPFLYDEFTGAGHFPVLAESLQSEEGARFYLESHWHRILLLPPETCIEAPEGFRWLAEAEISFFLNLGETVNSCARSVLACLL